MKNEKLKIAQTIFQGVPGFCIRILNCSAVRMISALGSNNIQFVKIRKKSNEIREKRIFHISQLAHRFKVFIKIHAL